MANLLPGYRRLPNGSSISKHAIVYPTSMLGARCLIAEFSVVGRPSDRRLISSHWKGQCVDNIVPTYLGNECVVQPNCLVVEGAMLSDRVYCAPNTYVGESSLVGTNTKLDHGTKIHEQVIVGDLCRIRGILCNGTRVGNRTTFFGQCAHRYLNHGGDPDEGAPEIGDDVIVGLGATLVGAIKIGNGSYIAPGAVVTKDVPSGHIAFGINNILLASSWTGALSGEFKPFQRQSTQGSESAVAYRGWLGKLIGDELSP